MLLRNRVEKARDAQGISPRKRQETGFCERKLMRSSAHEQARRNANARRMPCHFIHRRSFCSGPEFRPLAGAFFRPADEQDLIIPSALRAIGAS
ncbi:hypothetical protein [Herbaspirillum robiniae]|uniref:hypothetical protein n=1 Tax=Herbaspirillum robiniae TaxID=2014887 RepID=UPI003D77E930